MADWAAFAHEAPELAAAGLRLLGETRQDAIGLLASVGADGTPHLAPVCPVFCGGALYLSVAARSPKRRDLEADGRYVLHAFLGEGDEEFQVAGRAARVADPEERARVHRAIRFVFQRDDPLFRLDVARVLHVAWERPGQPGTRAVPRRWCDAEAGVAGRVPRPD
jgi:hypothetical protein